MPWFGDIGRLANGLSLVAKEAAKRSQILESAQHGDFQSLITSSAKKLLLSATDLSGLTRGKLQEFSGPPPPPNGKETSVVFFADAAKESHRADQVVLPLSSLPSSSDDEVPNLRISSQSGADGREVELALGSDAVSGLDNNVESEGLLPKESDSRSSPSDGANANAVAVGEFLVKKRRKPRERKVPSTPFSRAIG